MLKGFKDFIFRGNEADPAVGVIIGAAFGSVVSSLVKDILTPYWSHCQNSGFCRAKHYH